MFLEDIIHASGHISGVHNRDLVLFNSFSDQIWMGKGLTQKQLDMSLKLLKKYHIPLSVYMKGDVLPHLTTPTLRLGVRKIEPQPKKITVLDKDTKKFSVSFPYDENLVGKLRSFNNRQFGDSATWDSENKFWAFPLTERAAIFLKNEVVPQGFEACDQTQAIFDQIDEILVNFEDFVPQLKYEDELFYFKNTHPSVPQPENMNFLESLYHAKRYGITTWDSGINEVLENGNFSIFTKKFLNSSESMDLEINGDEHGIEIFDELIDLLTPTLIIIPPGSEIVHLRKWWTYLSAKNFTKNQISVMFRTDNTVDRIFNELIKEQGLNSPVTEDTKFVFVSHKLPKPIVKSKIDFKLVINLGALPGVHYSLQSYLVDFPDQVKYTNRKK
jgi:hypothetical protein